MSRQVHVRRIDSSDESRTSSPSEQVTEVDLTPLSTCPLHELRTTQNDLGWAPDWKADLNFNPRYANWDRLPRLNRADAAPPSRQERERSRERESSEERPTRGASPRPPRQTARRGRPASAPQRHPEPRPRKKPRIVPQMPPPTSSESGSDTALHRNQVRSGKRAQRAPQPVAQQAVSRNSPPPASPRQRLERKWNVACQAAGVALVAVGELNADAAPQLAEGFKWIEAGYDLGDGVLPVDEGFLVSCGCGSTCQDAQTCECQEELQPEEDEDGQLVKTFAYDDDGLFKFDRPIGAIVIECNKNCSCRPGRCPNRVAQHPRTVAVQIFKTDSRGWGVRAAKKLPKGKVLGLYTGKLITRQEAAGITGENKSYIFDLDALEEGESIPEDKKYSVDAYKQGNWTRFVNHSCEPNLEVYPVVWDTPVSMNRPYLAFVTKQEIPAQTEFTIDYDPRAARDKKGKKRQRPGAKECRCGTESCRGWVAV